MTEPFKSFIANGILSSEPPILGETEELRTFTKSLQEKMSKAEVIGEQYVLAFKENLNGQTYSTLFQRWEQWFFSSAPYQNGSSDVLFLRGNMENYTDPKAFLDMTALSGNTQKVEYGTYVLVPAITAGFNIGEYYKGQKIVDEETLHTAVQDYVKRGGPRWSSIEFLNTGNKVYRLPLFYAETPLFQLHVASDNPFRKYVSPQQEAGDFFTVCAGYLVILKDLPTGMYRIRFGGVGRQNYYTDAVWDIEILGDEKQVKAVNPEPPDISSKRHPSLVLALKYLSTTVK